MLRSIKQEPIWKLSRKNSVPQTKNIRLLIKILTVDQFHINLMWKDWCQTKKPWNVRLKFSSPIESSFVLIQNVSIPNPLEYFQFQVKHMKKLFCFFVTSRREEYQLWLLKPALIQLLGTNKLISWVLQT